MNNDMLFQILAQARFKPRSDTFENWEAKNPILLSGEPGVVIDGTETEKIKFGDGDTPWNDLGWWYGPKGDKGDTGEKGAQGEQGIQGPKGDTGERGDSYVLTEADKVEIADIATADINTALDGIIAIQNSLKGDVV